MITTIKLQVRLKSVAGTLSVHVTGSTVAGEEVERPRARLQLERPVVALDD